MAALSLAAVLLSGCAATNPRFPSLLPRAAESRSSAEPVPSLPDLVADPAIDARAAALAEELRAADQAFAPLAARATALTAQAKSAGIGSDAWLAAQSSLAELDTLRARSLSALSEIDGIAIDRGVAGQRAYPLLDTVRAQAEAQTARQTETIEALQNQLPSG